MCEKSLTSLSMEISEWAREVFGQSARPVIDERKARQSLIDILINTGAVRAYSLANQMEGIELQCNKLSEEVISNIPCGSTPALMEAMHGISGAYKRISRQCRFLLDLPCNFIPNDAEFSEIMNKEEK